MGPDILARYQGGSLDVALPGPDAMRRNETIALETLDDIRERYPFVVAGLPHDPPESLIAIPLRSSEGSVLGALVVVSSEPKWPDADTSGLLASVANQVGSALERAQLFEEVLEAREQEHAIVERLQSALLPDGIVDHPQLSIAAAYRAAGKLLAVGGDWYDTFEWPDGHVGIMVADVAGHDIEAAAAMGRLRASIAALAAVTEPSPAALLAALDRCASGRDGTGFVTAACVVVHPASGRTTYSTAGHPPPLVVGRDGSALWLDQAASSPLGFGLKRIHSEATIVLDPHSVIVLYSDGLVERRGELMDAGLARPQSASIACITDGGQVLPDSLIATLAADSVGDDDIVVVTARLRVQWGQ